MIASTTACQLNIDCDGTNDEFVDGPARTYNDYTKRHEIHDNEMYLQKNIKIQYSIRLQMRAEYSQESEDE